MSISVQRFNFHDAAPWTCVFDFLIQTNLNTMSVEKWESVWFTKDSWLAIALPVQEIPFLTTQTKFNTCESYNGHTHKKWHQT